MEQETFSDSQTIQAIQQWLDYGMESYNGGSHRGYFSGEGWAARCLRAHLQKLKGETNDV